MTELGGVICTGLKIKPNEIETKNKATKVKCGKWRGVAAVESHNSVNSC